MTRSTFASPIAAASLPEAPACVPSASVRAIAKVATKPQDELRKPPPDFDRSRLLRAGAGIDVVRPDVGEDEGPDTDEDVDENFDRRSHRQHPARLVGDALGRGLGLDQRLRNAASRDCRAVGLDRKPHPGRRDQRLVRRESLSDRRQDHDFDDRENHHQRGHEHRRLRARMAPPVAIGRRLFAAAEVRAAGRGGLALVSRITGLARSTLNRGEDDLDGEPLPAGRIRRKGGGRRAIGAGSADAGTAASSGRAGDARRSDASADLGFEEPDETGLGAGGDGPSVCPETVRGELLKLGFSRQGNRTADEGSRHPDRDAQFEYINATVMSAQRRGRPVVSVDTKKKELVGNFKNGGTDYRPKGDPLRVNVHDFEDKTLGKVAPYGVYGTAPARARP